MRNLQELALSYLAGGLSLVPCDGNTKRPRADLLPVDGNGKASWKPFQEKPATVEDVKRWVAHGCDSVAVVCGAVSGGLLILDFDVASFYPAWREAVGELADGLPVQQTGGGGYQVALRCPDPGKNDKLAWSPAEAEPTGRTIAIETRGEGGYAILPGSLHPTGSVYRATAGDWSDVPTVSQAQADALLAAARKLDRAPLTRQQTEAEARAWQVQQAETRPRRNGEGSVIDAYNQRTSIVEALQTYGYKAAAGGQYIRPAGKSPSVTILDAKASFHHSTDDPLCDRHAHTPFDLFCYHEHGGDCSAAVRAASEALGLGHGKNGRKPSGGSDTIAKNAGKTAIVSECQRRILWKPFPTDSLPEPVAGFVRGAAKSLGCDESLLAVPLLVALGSAGGATVQIRLKADWTEPLVFWAAMLAESGGMKTPALNASVSPLRRAQEWAMLEYPELCQQYTRDLALFEADYAAWKKTGRAKNEPPPEKPDEPQPKRFLVDDVTIEALADRLQHNPRGLLCCVDELAGWLNGFGQYKTGGKSSDVARWLSIHRAGSLLVDRKTGAIKTLFVPRAAVSVLGGIQPETFRRCLGVEHFANGLAARLLVTMPPRQAKRWSEANIDPELQNQVDRVYARLLGFGFHEAEDGRQEPLALPLSPEGKLAWITFYNEHAQSQLKATGNEAAMLAKLEAYAARFALLVHLIRVCADDPSLDTEEIDADSVSSGVALVRWFGNEARRVYASLAETDDDQAQRELVELIRRHGGTMTPRDLQRVKTLATTSEAEAALSDLVKAGLGEWVTVTHDGPGRPAQTFRILSEKLSDSDTNTVSPGEKANCVREPGLNVDEINRRFAEAAEL